MTLADHLEVARRLYEMRAADRASVVHRKIERDAHLIEKPRDFPRLSLKPLLSGKVAHRLRLLNRRSRAAGKAAFQDNDLGNHDIPQGVQARFYGVDAGFEIGGHGGSLPVADAVDGMPTPSPSESKKGSRK